jgi:hypothetical protein
MPPFTYHNGRLLTNVEVTAIFGRIRQLNPDGTPQLPTWVDSTTTTGQPIPAVCSINSFLRDVVGSAYLRLLATEYSVSGGPQIGHGSLQASRLIELPITQPANSASFTIKYTDVEAMIDSSIQSGVVPAPGANSCYIVFFGDVLVVDQQGGIVGQNAGGFHAMFPNKAGINITYCVVDSSDFGGSNTTFYATHELVEAITNPDNNGFNPGNGWYDAAGHEIADVCTQADNLNGPPFFHGYNVANFWVPSRKTCSAPPDDTLLSRGAVVRISANDSSEGCIVGIPCNTEVAFAASASIGGAADLLTDCQWTAQDGAQTVGPTNHLACTVLTPNLPGQFSVQFTAVDGFGCSLQEEATFVCVPAVQIGWAEEVCKLKHLILKDWRFINPIWGSSRDFGNLPVHAVELRRMRDFALQLDKLISLLERQPSVQHNRGGPKPG